MEIQAIWLYTKIVEHKIKINNIVMQEPITKFESFSKDLMLKVVERYSKVLATIQYDRYSTKVYNNSYSAN